MALEPACNRRVHAQIEKALRALTRPSAGVHHGQTVEVAVEREPSRTPRHLDRARERRGCQRARDDERHCVEPRKGGLYTARMSSERALQNDLDRQIVATHRRFVKAMDGRLGTMGADTKERYFAVLAVLVTKLEETDKPLKEVMQEMVSEAGHMILQEMTQG